MGARHARYMHYITTCIIPAAPHNQHNQADSLQSEIRGFTSSVRGH
jgi:hypothetical protein